MDQEPENRQNQENRRSIKDLLIWLALIPFILGTLLCCGQLALVLIPGNPSTKTSSLLSADYGGWPYESIPPIDIERFLRDIEREQQLYASGGPEGPVIDGVYWQPPTPVVEIGLVTPITGTPGTSTPTQALRTPTRTSTPTPTSAMATAARTPTSTTQPTVTQTVTRTLPPPPPLPTWTFTDEPEEEDTRTPTRTRTLTPTATHTATAENTITLTPTATETLTPTPTYAPVRPFAENDGNAEQVPGGGCRAFFGYRNDNPQPVDIPVSEDRNWIDDPVAQANPPQPTHFEVGRIFSVFEFTWFTGQDLTWWLDGRPAVATWCNPPPP